MSKKRVKRGKGKEVFSKKCKRGFLFIWSKYRLLTKKKYTTIAGLLVYFLVMSIIPLSVWLTLLFGRLQLPIESIVEMPVFQSIKGIILFIQKEAQNGRKGVDVVLIFTTLYSATSLFYHLRKSGELVYEYNREKSGWKIRISAAIVLFLVMIVSAASLLIVGAGMVVFRYVFEEIVASLLSYALLITVSFGVALILNIYACPYKAPVRMFLSGSLITSLLWAGGLIGFSVYLQIGNLGKLYDALEAVIIFLLWLYVLTICFVIGMVFNSEKITVMESKKL